MLLRRTVALRPSPAAAASPAALAAWSGVAARPLRMQQPQFLHTRPLQQQQQALRPLPTRAAFQPRRGFFDGGGDADKLRRLREFQKKIMDQLDGPQGDMLKELMKDPERMRKMMDSVDPETMLRIREQVERDIFGNTPSSSSSSSSSDSPPGAAKVEVPAASSSPSASSTTYSSQPPKAEPPKQPEAQKLQKQELEDAARSMGYSPEELFRMADTNNDGVVSEQEFRDWLRTRPAMRRYPSAGAGAVEPDSDAESSSGGSAPLVAPPGTPRPTNRQLLLLAIHVAPPFLAFGFLDNMLMLVAGDLIDQAFGVALGLSVMAAAGLGNTVGDVISITASGWIESTLGHLGLPSPGLTRAQQALPICRNVGLLTRALAIMVGCLLGMTPLLLINTGAEERHAKVCPPPPPTRSVEEIEVELTARRLFDELVAPAAAAAALGDNDNEEEEATGSLVMLSTAGKPIKKTKLPAAVDPEGDVFAAYEHKLKKKEGQAPTQAQQAGEEDQGPTITAVQAAQLARRLLQDRGLRHQFAEVVSKEDEAGEAAAPRKKLKVRAELVDRLVAAQAAQNQGLFNFAEFQSLAQDLVTGHRRGLSFPELQEERALRAAAKAAATAEAATAAAN